MRISNNNSRNDPNNVFPLVIRVLIPITLLLGGLILLALKISGWSIILGLPMIVIGTVFLIYEYDHVVTRHVMPIRDDMQSCITCGRLTKLKNGETKKAVVCPYCRWDIDRGRIAAPNSKKKKK